MQYQSLNTRILRLPETLKITGLGRSTLYKRIDENLITPPVSLGGASVGWPEIEIAHIVSCRIAGKTDDEVRIIVSELIKSRGNIFEVNL